MVKEPTGTPTMVRSTSLQREGNLKILVACCMPHQSKSTDENYVKRRTRRLLLPGPTCLVSPNYLRTHLSTTSELCHVPVTEPEGLKKWQTFSKFHICSKKDYKTVINNYAWYPILLLSILIKLQTRKPAQNFR